MVSFKIVVSSIALSSAVLAAPPQANYTNLCYSDITNIDHHVKELTEKAKSFNGGLFWALPQVPLALEVAVATASAGLHSAFLARPLPVADLLRLVDHVNKTLAVDGPLVLETFISKESVYEQTGLKAPIHLGLKVYLVLYQRFVENILDRVPADAPKDRVEILKRDIQVITDSLQKTIKVYE
ncbi:hypothetical protein J3458_021234 [Metarhizium acridum]|uniref:Cell wall galactomannoprotein n=1 Tax=Metarhizium acridum (strain CQMa 102) TaxID=655827 RepID=E9EFF1_METAQ|nr:uncharacterized protein MAC_08599 [Metarhizium acridum CQMa 102]EFY85350.1 hypothetical protein MAC_08599 [Metarhizium acridum CQMa 102]KAG8406401.1 hypothetical protein J3458_021234 [Metarhizium acridum]